MTLENRSTREEVPPELLAEAGVWLAQLHGPNRTRAMEAGFRRWLNASPAHKRGFELATEVWEDSKNLARVVPWEPTVRRTGRRRTAVALAAAMMVAAVSAIFYFGHAGVSTDIGEQRQVTLDDGTRVFLNTATRIVVSYDEQVRRVQLEEGEALFHVAKQPNRPFVVTVGNHQIRALGTSFVVRRDEQRIAVTLVEGKVSIAPTEMPNVPMLELPAEIQTLNPGERLILATSAPPALDRPVLDEVIAWRRGQVILEDTPLAEAIREMNRYNKVKLAIERPEAAGLLVNGLFQAGDSQSFAAAVAQTYGLEVIEEPRRLLLTGVPSDVSTPSVQQP